MARNNLSNLGASSMLEGIKKKMKTRVELLTIADKGIER